MSSNCSENRAVYKVMSKNMVEPEGRKCQYSGPLHAGLVRLHARKHMSAPVHTEILIAFPRQQWFRARASTLRYAYISSLVDTSVYSVFLKLSFSTIL